MKPAYFEAKARIVALAMAYYEGNETTKACLRKHVDFFPISDAKGESRELRSIIIRVGGEIFLVEDTRGGESGVFSLLLPVM